MTRLPLETFTVTGQFPYVVIHHPEGWVWNTTLLDGAGDWEPFNGGHWAQYAIPLTEQTGSGYYSAPYPAAIGDVLTTDVVYYGETPTLGDNPGGGTNSQGTNIAAIAADAAVPQSLQRSLATMVRGAVIAGTLTTTAFTTDVVNAEVNAFQGRSVLFATGALAGQGGVISAFDPDTGLLTVTGAFTAAPAVDDVFVIS